jgi:hypothetical protein
MSTRAGSLAPTTCASWSPRSMTLGDHSSRVALPSSQIVTRMQYVTHSRSIRAGAKHRAIAHSAHRTEFRERRRDRRERFIRQIQHSEAAEPPLGIGADDPLRPGESVSRHAEQPLRQSKLRRHRRQRPHRSRCEIERIKIPPAGANIDWRCQRGGGSGPVATHAPRRRVEADVLENLFIGDELRLYPHQRQHQDASWCQGRAAMPRFRLQDLASLRSQC